METSTALIVTTQDGILDIKKCLNIDLVPDLYFEGFTIIDTLPGCDREGIADAGETVEVYLTIKNGGGYADSVWAKLRFGQFEDTTIADLIDSTSYIGNISTWGELSGEYDPFQIKFGSEIVNNRDVCFIYEIGAKNWYDVISNQIILNVTNGIEIGGLISGTVEWSPHHQYLIVENARVDESSTLIIKPGTQIGFYPNTSLDIRGKLIADGKKDSLINFHGIYDKNYNSSLAIRSSIIDTNIINYSIFNNLGCPLSVRSNYAPLKISNCIFKNNIDGLWLSSSNIFFHRNNINNNTSSMVIYLRDVDFKYNNIIHNYLTCSYIISVDVNLIDAVYNSIYGNYSENREISICVPGNYISFFSFENNYWGTTDSVYIKEIAYDFFDNSNYPILDFSPFLYKPNYNNHGHVWKIQINGHNPQFEQLNPLGQGNTKFEVFYNRPMDISYNPFLSFGIREPFTQHIVIDNACWSADSTIWTAYFDIGLETGDGIQTIRVANAKDDEHFEIPIEDSRFKFVIQAAGAASIAFQATPGIGKVDLEWPSANTEDVLGYNIYRYQNLTDSTFTDTIRINTELVVDTLYADFDVVPDYTYHYLYKILGTDMQESDFSKSVSATPFSAANGDANGDLAINVLDITTIVDFMLLNQPKPFLFDAADFNGDDEINVLVIISIINIILSKKSDFSQESATYANFSIQANQVWIDCDGSVAAYLFVLKGDIEGFGIKSLYPMETFIKRISEDEYMVIVFSLNQSVFPEGNYPILSIFRDKEKSSLTGYDLVVSDINGQPIKGQFLNTGTYVPEVQDQSPCYTLEQNHPNPFNISTRISYTLPYETDVLISIYNTLGKLVYHYYKANETEGKHTIIWNGEDGSGEKTILPGIYFYQLRTKDYTNTKRMIYMRNY